MLTLLWFALACAPPNEPEEGVALRDDAPWAVARTHLRAAGRTGRPFAVEVSFPVEPGTLVLPDEAPFPAVVLVQGGAVDHRRYLWLADALAAEGQVVVTPAFPTDLAIFATRRADRALERALDLSSEDDPVLAGALDGAPAAILGHSLGGVVGAMRWSKRPDRFGPLALLASYPADGTEIEGDDRPALSLTGSADGRSALADVEAGIARFDGEAWLGVVEGMNHMDWADDATAKELADDGPPAPDQAAVRLAAVRTLADWLAHARGGPPPEAPEGVRLERLDGE